MFTGLFFRTKIAASYQAHGLPLPYEDTARRKIMPEDAEQRIPSFHRPDDAEETWGALFRKTSYAVAYAHGEADYNGHHGVRELCDICPAAQLRPCADAWHAPHEAEATAMDKKLGAIGKVDTTDRSIVVEGLDEPPRYYLQRSYGYQCHDRSKPHHYRRHGRADIGWPARPLLGELRDLAPTAARRRPRRQQRQPT